MEIQINLWVIALIECKSGPVKPLYFYDKRSDIWSKEQKLGMTFVSEKEAEKMLDTLGVDAEIIEIKATLEE